mmetsp:Transcript_18584/g.70293  ORF Transcript_18584/g.70293 Transcript_18584/m.70293 type:complete len:228 (+) Transcript_18584:2545-3228(+)
MGVPVAVAEAGGAEGHAASRAPKRKAALEIDESLPARGSRALQCQDILHNIGVSHVYCSVVRRHCQLLQQCRLVFPLLHLLRLPLHLLGHQATLDRLEGREARVAKVVSTKSGVIDGARLASGRSVEGTEDAALAAAQAANAVLRHGDDLPADALVASEVPVARIAAAVPLKRPQLVSTADATLQSPNLASVLQLVHPLSRRGPHDVGVSANASRCARQKRCILLHG